MTELINGRFIEDFGILFGSATGEAKTRKSFYEIDKEFELMTKTIEKNFVKVDSRGTHGFHACLSSSSSHRQAIAGWSDREAWGKAADHLAVLLRC